MFTVMTADFRHDELLHELGLYRGDADRLWAAVETITLQGGSEVEFETKGVTAIVGANNCGKSTLLRQLGELIERGEAEQTPRLISGIGTATTGTLPDFLDWLCRHAVLVENPIPSNSVFSRLGKQIPLGNLLYLSSQGNQFSLNHAASFLVRQMGAGERNVGGVGRKGNVLDAPEHPIQQLAENEELLAELNRITYRVLGEVLCLDDLNSFIQLRVGSPGIDYPSRFEDPTAYQLAVNALPPLDSQGDGMRSLLGILIPLVTATYPILIIDEPEAFLHPPQAFALGQELGRISVQKGVQVILATHDRNLLAGLLNSSSPLSVVRLVRNGDETTSHQLKSQELKAIWDDPVLKYSNVLDGLFHRLVVLAENERDCRFYEAALDAYAPKVVDAQPQKTIPATDVLFVPTSGTGGMAKVAKALRALEVPVVASPDLDVLDNEVVLKGIVESLGGSWAAEMHDDWAAVTESLNHAQAPLMVSQVAESLRIEFEKILSEDPMSKYEAGARRRISEALGASRRPWSEVKNYGIDALRRLSGCPQAVDRLVAELARRGVVVVEQGELESFGYSLGVPKGKAWLPAALQCNLQSSTEVQAHIARLLAAALS